jgi:chromosome partitioning protein
MAAKIISIGNQKGGVGKSTVTMQLAGSLARRGKKVLVVDADEQATATRWASMSEDTPFPATVVGLAAAGAKLHRELQKFVDQYDFILVDCPPSVSAATPQSAFLVSDLVLIPTRPSLADIWAVQETIKLVERAKAINEGIQTAILLNARQPNTQLGRDAEEILAAFDAHLLTTTLHMRQAYAQSIVLGSTVHSVPGGKAATAEVEALTDEVLALIGIK